MSTAVIGQILPAAAHAVESFTEREVALFPAELAAVARAVDKRRREFTTVRACARDALAALGHPPAPLVPGERGAPSWPVGVVGSMTHCAGYRAAVVADAAVLASIGVDGEPNEPLPDGVLSTIALDEEQSALPRLPVGDVAWDRLLFCAKEAVYKTWFPLTGRWLGFEQASITVDPAGTFSARLLVDGPVLAGRAVQTFAGRWRAHRGLLVTAIAVPAAQGAPTAEIS